MWGIDRDLGVRSSYYFRLSTLAPALMADIARAAAKASYHYEELATVAKRRASGRGRTSNGICQRRRPSSRRNLASIRSTTGLPMPVVSSHGDFVNRRLGVANWALLADTAFREAVGVEAEAYDDALLGRLTSQYSDMPYPRYWIPLDPTRRSAPATPSCSCSSIRATGAWTGSGTSATTSGERSRACGTSWRPDGASHS